MSATATGASPRDWDAVPRAAHEPDFDNLLAVLRREQPSRPTLFEFFLKFSNSVLRIDKLRRWF